MEERWLPIAGYEGWYEVSDLGRVRSVTRVIQDRLERERVQQQVYMRPRLQNAGYVIVSLRRGGKQSSQLVHRLVLTAFDGPCPEGLEGCHNDGDRTNNALDNLRWDTRSANHLDKREHGTHHLAVRTHCPRGHAYISENLVPSGKGRSCLACSRGAAFIRNSKRDRRPHGSLQAESDRYYRELTGRSSAGDHRYERTRSVCPRGHVYEPRNLVPSAKHRMCLACCRAKAAIRYARKTGRQHLPLVALSDWYYQQILA